MNRFWDIIIEPLFNEIKPKYIVEIGSFTGENTKRILNYCKKNNSKLASIDPAPRFDVKEYKQKFPENFYTYEDISLNALSNLEGYDIILIDGDHNWYTVYNELKLIENKFSQDDFPFIIMHDVSWPYGRRDGYYSPKDIPEEFRNEYKKRGMRPYRSELMDVGGINPFMDNAVSENTPKNGVLTAIEDFLNESTLDLSFYKINGFNGLGIIYPTNKQSYEFIDKIVRESNIGEVAEKEFYINIIGKINQINAQKGEINQLKSKINELEQNMSVSPDPEILKNLHREQGTIIKIMNDALNEIGELKNEIDSLKNSNSKY